MSQTSLLIGLLFVYLIFLAGTAFKLAKTGNVHNNSTNNAQSVTANQNYLFGSGFGFALSFFGIAATLFSTFTLTGMPAFFKNHGIASWVFLGVTDVILAGVLLYFGLKMRHFVQNRATKNNTPSIKNLTELLKQNNLPRWVVLFFVSALTLFMIPYITIQIKGTAVLMQSALPLGSTHLTWSVCMVVLMLTYSWFGGLRAIFVTDMVQGIVLLVTVWAIAYFAISASGGVAGMFTQIQSIKPELLSAPGPIGVLNWQFLLIGFISIILMPYVQPQMATRIFVVKSDRVFTFSSMALALFAILVVLPTLFIGLRSVIVSQTITEGNFLLNVISSDAPVFFFALFIVGVLAAAMSTADSQLMAIGTEWSSAVNKQDIQQNDNSKLLVKLVSVFVAVIALVLAQSSFKSLVLFAVNSFVGTSLLLPIVYAAFITKGSHKLLLIASSVISVVVFFLSLFAIAPKMLMGIRIELILYVSIAIAMGYVWLQRKTDKA